MSLSLHESGRGMSRVAAARRMSRVAASSRMSRVAAWGCCIVGMLLIAVAVVRAEEPKARLGAKKCKVASAALVKQAAAAKEYTCKSFAAALGRQKLAPARMAWRQSQGRVRREDPEPGAESDAGEWRRVSAAAVDGAAAGRRAGIAVAA